MPVYDFSCPREGCHGFKLDVYLPTRATEPPVCGDCGDRMERAYSLALTHIAASSFPFVTRNIDPNGNPIEVTSPGHLKELCAQYGVTQRDDAGWLTKEYVGYDLRTRKQIYKESSGVGLPGCWV